MWRNKYYTDIVSLKEQYLAKQDGYEIEDIVLNPEYSQLDEFLVESDNPNFKIIHPVLIKGYKMPALKYSDEKLKLIGFDVETDADTGEPRLFGMYTPRDGQYHHMYRPTLPRFFDLIKSLCESESGTALVTWGQLDIQAIIRLFEPTESERKQISRGLSANVVKGEMLGNAPIIRNMNDKKHTIFYIAHYIAGRSLKLGYIENSHEHTIWIFNCSQFYQGRIAQNAKGLKLPWKDFATDTHIVDWSKYQSKPSYRKAVLDSNYQDARTVYLLADKLQDTFYSVFQAYPTLLVSKGSLTDAAVSAMLRSNKEEYQSNSFKWLSENIWKPNGVSEETIEIAQMLASLSYSAGYIDQFGIGYWDTVCTADISSAYPHKIRNLPDLRESVIFEQQSDSLEYDLQNIQAKGYEIETAFIHGLVTIPPSLKYHPITIKTYSQENYRPTGTFYAGYGLDSRKFCKSHGATFENETWVIIALKKRVIAPIANVSIRLGEMRENLRNEMKSEKEGSDRYVLLDGQQYMVKVIDNSIYGKTVMTTETVENIDGTPRVVGYVAGDRFNLIYGSLITERTRIQIAEICRILEMQGSRPIMTMTDAVYWHGNPDHMPTNLIAKTKTAGYFEPVEIVKDFYLLKTGQYEYRTVKDGKFHYKMRGFHVDYDKLDGKESFYHTLLNEHLADLSHDIRADKISIAITTRKLVTIGQQDMSRLGAIVEGTTHMRPFVFGSKQANPYIENWWDCLNAHVWLDIQSVTDDAGGKIEKNKYLNDKFRDNLRVTIGGRRTNHHKSGETRPSKLRRSLEQLDLGLFV